MDKYHLVVTKRKSQKLISKVNYVGFFSSSIHRNRKTNNNLEFFYLTDGKGTISINSNSFNTYKGDIHIFTPNSEIEITTKDNNVVNAVYFGVKPTDYLLQKIDQINTARIQTKSNINLFDNLFTSLFNETKESSSSPQITQFVNLIILKLLSISSEKEKDETNLFYQIKNYLDSDYRSDLNLDDLQKRFSLSKFYLLRMFRDYAGCTPMKYVTLKKIDLAKKLILKGDKSIEEISEYLNYTDKYYFSRAFTKIVGISPYKYSQANVKKEEKIDDLEIETKIIYHYNSGQFYPAAETKVEFKKKETNMIKLANRFIANPKNYANVNNRYRPKYHFSVPIGWLNDPNGLVEAFGKFHMMYQFDPYTVTGGLKYWGHASTLDFIHWKNEPVAIAPDESYDKGGCWSGGSIASNGKVYTIYTSYLDGVQQQCVAESYDGNIFTKSNNNPVITSDMLPDHCEIYAFRDPYIIENNGTFYCGCAAHDIRDYGKILLYKSNDLEHFSYVGLLLEEHISKGVGMFECPNFAHIDGEDVLLSSINWSVTQGHSYQNFASVVAYVGTLNYEQAKFEHHGIQELDFGLDFYATQITKTHDGRYIVVAWLQMWERDFPTQKDGWVGSVTFPREITIKNHHVYQKPVRELEKYCFPLKKMDNQLLQNANLVFEHPSSGRISLKLDLTKCDDFIISLFKNNDEESTLAYSRENKTLTFSRENMATKIGAKSELEEQAHTRIYDLEELDKMNLDILIDVSTIEIFINNGYATMSSNVYPIHERFSFEIKTNSCLNIDELYLYEIKV